EKSRVAAEAHRRDDRRQREGCSARRRWSRVEHHRSTHYSVQTTTAGTMPPSTDGQIVELRGRNWLVGELLRAGLEVARPERDRGIDLIAYADLDATGRFVARPIQMKAATGRS